MRVSMVRLGFSDHYIFPRSLAARANFDDWIAQNPLPKRSIATEVHIQSPPESETSITRRFRWQETPALLNRLDSGAEQLQWSRSSRLGEYAAHTPSLIGAPAYVLTLPKVLLHFWGRGGNSESASDELQKLTQAGSELSLGKQLMVLLSADSVALAMWSDDDALIRHKVLTGYTTRRQQGKSQLSYLRQGGGGHSVGGAIRARETLRLFQSGADKLYEWRQDIDEASMLFQGGGVRNWNELYAAKSPAMPVARNDSRWQPVGVGVRRPRLRDLENVRKELCRGTLLTMRGALQKLEYK